MITLYHVPRSRSVRSLWLLHELDVAFRVVEMPFAMKALRAPEYLAISPAGRVPCIDDDGLIVFESGAIAQYLCHRYDPEGLGRRPEHSEWVEWLEWIHFSETMAVHASYLVQQANFVSPENRSEAVVNLERRRLRKTLEVVDRRLADREHILPSGFSAADVAVAYSIFMGDLYAAETGGLENLLPYFERIKARPGFRAATMANVDAHSA
jgi:glutathione S-transferase